MMITFKTLHTIQCAIGPPRKPTFVKEPLRHGLALLPYGSRQHSVYHLSYASPPRSVEDLGESVVFEASVSRTFTYDLNDRHFILVVTPK